MEADLTFEHITIINEIISAPRQLTFETFRNNRCKIGMNTRVNKLYHVRKIISIESLNLKFVHYKKLMKFQFKKNGNT